MTSKPFGVNVTLLPAITPPDYPAYCRVIIEEGVKIVETAGNNPAPVIKQLKSADITVIHKCVAIRHALSAQKLGVDFVSIDGFECAGHPGEEDITGLILLAKAAKALSIPYIASGGFADGHGLAAALALGAQGVNMGTRFMCTVESPIHQKIKEDIVNSDEHDTILMLRSFHNTTRVYKNVVSEEVVKTEERQIKENRQGDFGEVRNLVAGARGNKVYTEGDKNFGVWSAGQSLGLINDIPTCADLLVRIEREALDAVSNMTKMVVPKPNL